MAGQIAGQQRNSHGSDIIENHENSPPNDPLWNGALIFGSVLAIAILAVLVMVIFAFSGMKLQM